MRKSEMTKAEIGEQISVLLEEIRELESAMVKLKPDAAISTLTDAIAAAYQDLGVLEYLYRKEYLFHKQYLYREVEATPADTETVEDTGDDSDDEDWEHVVQR